MAPGRLRRRGCVLVFLSAALWASALRAQTGEEPPTQPRWRTKLGLEVKANYRDSQEFRFPVNFPFSPEQIPPGQSRVFEETVDPGGHFELSNVSLLGTVSRGDLFTVHAKIDLIDLHDRNPTSSGEKIDADEAWIRLGREVPPATLAPRGGVYLKVGKFAKFERQDDRHLESYGLVSTAFNRFEQTGGELGADLGQHLYVKVRAASGNPVFIRDPNALAGDNGTAVRQRPHPDPRYQSGVVILYNAHEANFNLDGELETGAGIGWRFADEGGRNGLDLFAWGNRRKMAKTFRIHGSFYGGDLDLLNGPGDAFPFAVTGDDKRESGGNVWLYLGGFSFFGQYVDQDLAGLPRQGLEGEVAWRFDLPLVWAAGGRQLFTFVAPAVRWSELQNDFRSPKVTPSPSFSWDWRKIDAGLRLGLWEGLDLTVEYAANRFILGSGAKRHNDELLTTLRWGI